MKTIIGLFAILFVVIIITVSALHSNNYNPFTTKSPMIQIGDKTFTVEEAKTQAAWQQGLSGRKSMPADQGMLFIFPQADYQQFWMKQMLFPLDMVFINNDKIVTIHQNVPIPPANASLSSLPIYASSAPANYVLELNAGTVKKDNIKVGDKVTYYNL